MKKLLSRIWKGITELWRKIDKFVETLTPIAIKVVDSIKSINESTTGDIIETILAAVIPGEKDKVIIQAIRTRLKKELPRILKALNISEAIAAIEDPNEQLKQIILSINLAPDEVRNAYYHSLCVLIINSLSDGKLTWSESIQIAEYYYRNIHKVN